MIGSILMVVSIAIIIISVIAALMMLKNDMKEVIEDDREH